MTTFSAYAANFDTYPKEGEALRRLAPLLDSLKRVDFLLRVADPSRNQGQMDSDLDIRLEQSILALGASSFMLRMPRTTPQKLDFAFMFAGQKVAVEIEKANREKILRDFLKCHVYLHAGADFALVVLPKNYVHKLGIWNLFEFGVHLFDDCRRYGFGTEDNLGRILLVGYEQLLASTNQSLSVKTRQEIRETLIRSAELS